ncbi:MAG TPA: hypothetical protein VGJ07_14835 [Rugosimonospora sp.]
MIAFWLMEAAAILGAVSALWHLPSLTGPARPFGVPVPAGRHGDAAIAAARRRHRARVVVAAGALVTVVAVSAAVRHGSAATIASATAFAVVVLFLIGGLSYRRGRMVVAGAVRGRPVAGTGHAGTGAGRPARSRTTARGFHNAWRCPPGGAPVERAPGAEPRVP